MPIYPYECPEDGIQDVFFRSFGVFPEWPCPVCGKTATKAITAPARVFVERDWNDKASDYQGHGPYHQAKSQLENIKRRAAEGGEPHSPITEEAIQVAAKEIDAAARSPRPDAQQRQIQKIRQDQAKRRNKQTD